MTSTTICHIIFPREFGPFYQPQIDNGNTWTDIFFDLFLFRVRRFVSFLRIHGQKYLHTNNATASRADQSSEHTTLNSVHQSKIFESSVFIRHNSASLLPTISFTIQFGAGC